MVYQINDDFTINILPYYAKLIRCTYERLSQ
jgi:hypothetical protein